MKEGLQPGLEHEMRHTVPLNKTVPCLYPESPSFQDMPHVIDVAKFNARMADKRGQGQP